MSTSLKIRMKLRILVVGDVETGKTSFIQKYINPNDSLQDTKKTYGAEAYMKRVKYSEGIHVDLDIWDTYAGENYNNLSNLFTRKAKGCFLLIDVSKL